MLYASNARTQNDIFKFSTKTNPNLRSSAQPIGIKTALKHWFILRHTAVAVRRSPIHFLFRMGGQSEVWLEGRVALWFFSRSAGFSCLCSLLASLRDQSEMSAVFFMLFVFTYLFFSSCFSHSCWTPRSEPFRILVHFPIRLSVQSVIDTELRAAGFLLEDCAQPQLSRSRTLKYLHEPKQAHNRGVQRERT